MSFENPGWLILLILVPVMGIGALLLARLKRREWSAFVAPRLRGALLKRSSALPRWIALFLLLAACATLVLALARPQGKAGVRSDKTVGRNVLIALDLSRSMRVPDVKPDRLSQAKIIIYELLEAMPNERIGIIGFAGSSYLYAPLTVDHSAVRETVEQIDEKWTTKGGSNLAEALSLAIDTLKKTGQKNNALVILSDGEQHDGDLDEMIVEAEKSGVYILAIGVGTEDGGFVPRADSINDPVLDDSGRPILSRLQPAVMRKLATETKGRYAVAGTGLDIPAIVKSVVDDLDAFTMNGRERKISVEFYQWLLLPTIFLLTLSVLAGTRWRGIKAAALGIIFLTPLQTDASLASEAKAALEKNNNQQAQESYKALADKSLTLDNAARYRLGEATAAYRRGDLRSARTAFSQALLSEDPAVLAQGHHGLANSLFQLGWVGLADDAYPADPTAVPDLDRFDTLVKERLAKLKESEIPEDGEKNGTIRFESLITNWVDAIRHYDSTLATRPKDPAALNNKALTLTYLRRLQELLKQEKEETQQAMPQPSPGPGEPQEGDGEGEPGGEGDGDGEPQDKKGNKGGEKKDPKGDQGERPDGKKKGSSGNKEESDKKSKSDDGDPNESPKERARRLLKENSDLEKGPISPGRREFRDPEKDW